jgi:hypothetical protein
VAASPPLDVQTRAIGCRAGRRGEVRSEWGRDGGWYPLPVGVQENLPRGQCESWLVPPFTDEEAADLLAARGAPESMLSSNMLGWFNGRAQGHPTLLAAIARYLGRTGWRLQREQVEGLMRWEHTADVTSETVRRLLETVDDSTARDLLYRLSVVIGEFGQQDIVAAAGVSPKRR